MSFLKNRKLYFGLCAGEIFTFALYQKNIIGIHGFYWCGLVAFSTLIYLGHKGYFPFIGKGQIGSLLAYFLAGLMPLWSINLLASSFDYPFWYPTAHGFWCFLPVVILGFVNMRLSASSNDKAET